MNYQVNKYKLMQKRDELLKEYKTLLCKTLELTVEISNMYGNIVSPIEIVDWIEFNSNDKEMEKLTRLAAALQYVEMPQDKDVIYNLQENIEINNSKNKNR